MPINNPFDGSNAAQRYAAGRPYFHPKVLEYLRPALQGQELGADVACGTGLSSQALTDLVEQVRAFDASPAMLAQATPHSRIHFAVASAEALPLEDHTLDVLTVAQAFHWFQRDLFLAEARRSLRPTGVLFLYDCYFTGDMPHRPDFKDFVQAYFSRYPTPPRHREPFGLAQAQKAGFTFEERTFQLEWNFTQPELVAYLMTHSNTLVVTPSGESPDEIRTWLDVQLQAFFEESGTATVAYQAWYAILQPC